MCCFLNIPFVCHLVCVCSSFHGRSYYSFQHVGENGHSPAKAVFFWCIYWLGSLYVAVRDARLSAPTEERGSETVVGRPGHIDGLLDHSWGEPPTKALSSDLYFGAGGNSKRLRRYHWGFFFSH